VFLILENWGLGIVILYVAQITCTCAESTLTCDQITISLCIAYAVLGGNVSSLCGC